MTKLNSTTLVGMVWLLVLGGAAFAQSVSVDLLSGTGDQVEAGVGVSMLDPWGGAATASGSFDIWSVVRTDIDLDTLSFDILVNGGAANGLFSSALPLAANSPNLRDSRLGDSQTGKRRAGQGTMFGMIDFDDFTFDPERFEPGDRFANPEAALSGTPVGAAKASPGPIRQFRADGHTFMGWTISFEELPAGTYMFSVGNLPSNPQAEWGLEDISGILSAGAVFTLVPEPASALLLLVALPLLRRRRA